jgi:hypothetical protein
VEFYQPPRVLLLSHSEISHRIVVEAFHIVDLLSHTHTQSTEECMVPVNVSFQSHPYFCDTFNQEVVVLFGFHETFLVSFSIFPGGIWEKVVLLDL